MVGAIYAPEIMSLVRLPENGAARILMLTKGALAAEAWVFSQTGISCASKEKWLIRKMRIFISVVDT